LNRPLAPALPADLARRDYILILAFDVVAFSLIVQADCASWLARAGTG
jgi:hypothetical protein